MKLSELIKQLQKELKEKGDLRVYYGTETITGYDELEISEIEQKADIYNSEYKYLLLKD